MQLKTFALAASFSLAIFTAGCASLGSYTLDENMLENYLRQEIVRFDQTQLKTGSPLSIALKDIDLTIGPNGRDVVVLDVTGNVGLNALMKKIPVDIALKVEGAPVYSSKDRAVYIRRLQLLDSRIDSPLFRGDLKPVTDIAMRMLGQMLETMPVYRLDENDPRLGILGSLPLDVKVGPGKLLFVPASR